jgi:small-conductance mechanosensitive channel
MSLDIEVDPLQNVFDLVNAQAAQEAKAAEAAQIEVEVEVKPESVVTQAEEVSESPDTQTAEEVEKPNSKQDLNKAVAEARALKNQERAAKEAALAELEQLRLENEALKQSKVNQDFEYTSEEELAALAEEVPEVAEKLRKVEADNKAKTDKLTQLEKARFDDVNNQLQAIKEIKIAAAFNANPKLVHIRENMPDLWEYALERDKLISALPEYHNASFEQRFNDVIDLVELKHGVIKLPSTETNQTDSKIASPKKVTKNEVPTSLTDIAGKAIVTERPSLAAATKGQVREMFKDKTSDEIMAAIRNY